MKNLGISELVASTHGLREGTLALFLHDHRWFTARSFEPARPSTASSRQREGGGGRRGGATLASYSLRGMISEYEYSLLLESIQIVKNAPQAADLKARFHELMGVDSPLSHVDQLRIAIAIICRRERELRQRPRGGVQPSSEAEGQADHQEAVRGIPAPRAPRDDEGAPLDQRALASSGEAASRWRSPSAASTRRSSWPAPSPPSEKTSRWTSTTRLSRRGSWPPWSCRDDLL